MGAREPSLRTRRYMPVRVWATLATTMPDPTPAAGLRPAELVTAMFTTLA